MFKLNQLSAACAVAAAGLVGALPAHAQISGDVIRIGFITDMSGLYADIDGPAGAEMIKQAVADMGGTVAGKKIEVLVADHQNKADVAAAKAREWFDTQGVDMLIGGTNSGTALAMAKVAAEKKIRDCLCIIKCGEATPHHVDEMNRVTGEINGRIAS